MKPLPTDTVEMCIQVAQSTLPADVTTVVQKLVQVLRVRFGAKVCGTAIVFPPYDGRLVIPKPGASPTGGRHSRLGPSDDAAPGDYLIGAGRLGEVRRRADEKA